MRRNYNVSLALLVIKKKPEMDICAAISIAKLVDVDWTKISRKNMHLISV